LNHHWHRTRKSFIFLSCICLLLLAACGGNSPINKKAQPPRQKTSVTATPTPVMTFVPPPQPTQPGHTTHPTPVPKPSAAASSNGRPVLAFYYPWYSVSTWNPAQMSDLPTIKYNSSDDATIARQLNWAITAGLTGFISSWWGPGDQTDTNFAKLLAHAASTQASTGYHFDSTIYFESDAPSESSIGQMETNLRYVINKYSNNANFFHWQGKPVIFFWDPLGHGRTLATWATIRNQVDPNHQTIWSAEGVDLTLLNVFDGIHLFSGAYWGLQQGDITAVDQGFRAKIDAYNQAHNTQKIWAAGIIPGYNDTRVPGRTGTYIVARNNGATYSASWEGAIASNPDLITITSFNEWFEGSMIEPSVTYGTLYLNLTQQFTHQW
jgi:hypothetical protein